ncbi:uncharacterized protein PFL1_06672 [Pseudozyma flocculosa PF-1]|uniref:ER-bound oxygenase mpaB/mpaB'/Rubber oxygenase catalytic domain-containing protein n=1 Tax=Pseudozyma flocculosa PF-1 TaxID=1277687 RepID=A0A061H1Z4_9BASI|nr:uncharacterized protein PFL1_06672 [Pseudozyma flocculosa PF-1]EPQ25805.1 hypothetical protein PFL1_06672 [Pseudozyma flocculosa PF-1]
MTSYLVAAAFVVGLHCLYVSAVRYARLRDIEARYGGKYSHTLEERKRTGKPRMIDTYTGVRDAQRIVRLVNMYDAPYLYGKAIEFGLFKTYAIPTISSLLLATGQLSRSDNAPRRYADTAGLIQAFLTYPLPPLDFDGQDDRPDSPESWECVGDDISDPRSAIALARMNFLHSRWNARISNDDLLYTLSVFVVEPVSWLERHEWRPMSRLEKEALFAMLYHVGRCMGIRDIPETYDELAAWSEAYEARHAVFAESNAQVATYTFDLLLYHVPASLHTLGRQFAASLMDDRLRAAFAIPTPPRAVCALKDTLLWPIYSRPFAKGSLGWLLETIKVRAGLLAEEDRRGSSKWRAATLPQQPQGPVQGLGGFRLEEMGPQGLESKGREQVLRNAEELLGRPLAGPWAFSA